MFNIFKYINNLKNIIIKLNRYLALTYDHRIMDGREAATFLKKLTTLIDDPRKILLDLWIKKIKTITNTKFI